MKLNLNDKQIKILYDAIMVHKNMISNFKLVKPLNLPYIKIELSEEQYHEIVFIGLDTYLCYDELELKAILIQNESHCREFPTTAVFAIDNSGYAKTDDIVRKHKLLLHKHNFELIQIDKLRERLLLKFRNKPIDKTLKEEVAQYVNDHFGYNNSNVMFLTNVPKFRITIEYSKIILIPQDLYTALLINGIYVHEKIMNDEILINGVLYMFENEKLYSQVKLNNII